MSVFVRDATIRVGPCWDPILRIFFYFLLCLLLLLTATDNTTMRVWTTAMHVIMLYVCVYALCVCSVNVQPRYSSNRTASLCGPLLCLCRHYTSIYLVCAYYMCDVCYDT